MPPQWEKARWAPRISGGSPAQPHLDFPLLASGAMGGHSLRLPLPGPGPCALSQLCPLPAALASGVSHKSPLPLFPKHFLPPWTGSACKGPQRFCEESSLWWGQGQGGGGPCGQQVWWNECGPTSYPSMAW